MKHETYRREGAGFTLVETLVVITIIAIMSGFMVVNFRQGELGNKLQRSAQLIVQGIREAQNMALSSTEYEGEVYDYYGAYFNDQSMTNSFYIFASSNKVYNPGEEVKTIDLEDGIVVDAVSTGTSVNIVFLPPYAFVEFNPTVANATITLKKEGGTCPQDCKCVRINNKGWMSIKTGAECEEELSGICQGGIDDPDCGTIDCSSWYVQTGTESATGTEYCYNKEDITSNRCEAVGDCKDANTSDCDGQSNDALQYSCGECQYINASNCAGTILGSCSNYPAGTSCGSGLECDGSGNCVTTLCSGGAGTDDPACGIIDCDGLNYYFTEGSSSPTGTNYCKYRDYADITSNRCEGVGDCKEPNSSDCTSYSDSTAATCGTCKYAAGACTSCSNYSAGTDCGGSAEQITDDSCGGHSPWGSATVDFDTKKFGASSAYMSDNLWASDHSDWTFGDNDFTIDFWVWLWSSGSLIQHWGDAGNFGWRTYYSDSMGLRFYWSPDGTVEYLRYSGGWMSQQQWHHIAIVRSGANIHFFIDGIKINTQAFQEGGNDTIYNSSANLRVNDGDHNIDELRISNTARWTSNFTPPSSEYSCDGNTKLLMHINERSKTCDGNGNCVE